MPTPLRYTSDFFARVYFFAGLALSVTLLPTAAFADPGQVYNGTLGRTPIVVELDTHKPGQIEGRYYYEKYRKDLGLYGKQNGASLELFEGTQWRKNDKTPQWVLQTQGDGWQGEWSGPNGKRYPITLKPVAIQAPKADAEPGWQAIYAKSPYDYLRVQSLKLTAGKRETFDGHELQWWQEPLSKVSMPEILSGYPEEERARLNRQLREQLWTGVVGYHECVANTGTGDADYNQHVTPNLMTPGVVSIGILTSYDCGGAHPDVVQDQLNLDAHSGDVLTLEDVLWVGQGKPFHYADGDPRSNTDFGQWSDYRARTLAPWLTKQLTAIAPKEMDPQNAGEADCNYADESVWHFATFRFTDKGLAFEPSFNSPVCGGVDWAVLPYELVAAHPGGHKVQLP